MNAEAKEALERLKTAALGTNPKALATVYALDVVTVAEAIPETKRTSRVKELAAGAAGANSKGDPDMVVFQIAGQIAELIAAAE